MTSASKSAGPASRTGPPEDRARAGEAAASVVLLYFAAARLAAGTSREEVTGWTVGGVLEASSARHGERFAAVLAGSRVWVNGAPAAPSTPLSDGDEVAVLPPVSGGSGAP